eukprot:1078999-Amphidinium_carterae.1
MSQPGYICLIGLGLRSSTSDTELHTHSTLGFASYYDSLRKAANVNAQPTAKDSNLNRHHCLTSHWPLVSDI